MSLEEFNNRDFNVELEGAGGMTHEAIAMITATLTRRGVDMHEVKKIIVYQNAGDVGIVLRDRREMLMSNVFEVPGKRKVFLPGAH